MSDLQAQADGGELKPIFADLHVHIGSAANGDAVKISASRNLTFRSIAQESSDRKGIGLIGVIDCHSPSVQDDIARCLDSGEMAEIAGGGIRYRDTVIVPGCEVEVMEPGGGPFHLLVYMPTFEAIREWTAYMAPHMKNVRLSSQRIRRTARDVQQAALALGGLLVPAHIFTPHRGLLGCSADRLDTRLDPSGVAAVELGLSADTAMASRLAQLDAFPFLTNSDAHSTGMIGRECNELLLAEPSFAEWAKALAGAQGRRIAANIGLHPLLGKYHGTSCAACRQSVPEDADVCPACGSARLVRGVSGRIERLADRARGAGPGAVAAGAPARPPYRPQVPLSFIPGVGPKMRERMLAGLGTEMDVLHRLPGERIAEVAGEKIARTIMDAREGKLRLEAGSGGTYGSVRGAGE